MPSIRRYSLSVHNIGEQNLLFHSWLVCETHHMKTSTSQPPPMQQSCRRTVFLPVLDPLAIGTTLEVFESHVKIIIIPQKRENIFLPSPPPLFTLETSCSTFEGLSYGIFNPPSPYDKP